MTGETYQLVYRVGEEERSLVLDRGETVMGRGPECQLQLTDYGISRQHAKVTSDGDDFVCIDLNSRNGTRVNGARITQVVLADGDEITLGKYPLHFRRQLSEKVVVSEGRPITEGGATVIRSVTELQNLMPGLLGAGTAAPPKPGAPAPGARDAAALEKSNRILLALGQLARDLITTQSQEDLLEKIMTLIFEHIPAERGFLMLVEDQGRDLVTKIVKYRDEKAAGKQGVTVSRTLVDKVLNDKVAIYSLDAGQEFAGKESIAAAKIRSFMCAPLWNQNRVIGLVQLDSSNLSQFSPTELDLLSAIANYAAVGIEQARLNRRIHEEQKAKSKLERYHSAAVIQRILSTGDSSTAGVTLDIQEVDCSILFADVVGFTSMSEHMEPRQVALVLNDFFSRMTDIIFQYEGTLDKYIGDEIMAIFGAPIPYGDHATRAIKAAQAMRRAQDEANRSRVPEARIAFRAGINSGHVVAGDIGSIKRMEYTVLGNAVNLASRLVKATPDSGKIIIGQPTYELVKDHFNIAGLGSVRLKGLREEMPIYEVLD
ncbi:MAG: FHA domain-containing protein [Acidobacteria bacterium]|nr:FHA domain-containing protein [Acidobacteriota bacterium]